MWAYLKAPGREKNQRPRRILGRSSKKDGGKQRAMSHREIKGGEDYNGLPAQAEPLCADVQTRAGMLVAPDSLP